MGGLRVKRALGPEGSYSLAGLTDGTFGHSLSPSPSNISIQPSFISADGRLGVETCRLRLIFKGRARFVMMMRGTGGILMANEYITVTRL